MGGVKREMENREAMYQLGLELCIEAGAIVECEGHPGSYYKGDEEVVEAYKIAARKVKAGEIGLTQQAVTDGAKLAYEDNSGIDYCPSCDKNARS